MSNQDNRNIGVRKSEFTADTAVPAAATFDYVVNGMNIKIPFSDLLPLLGTTGQLEQAGDTLSTPVLDDQGTIKAIRNLESGKGISASVSPQNGALLEHNFTQGTTGIPVLDNPTALSPLIRSIVAGDGATVVTFGDAIQIGLGAGQAIPDSLVFVQSEADFPVPIGGISTLEEKTYLISAPGVIEVSFRLKFANSRTVLTGFGRLFSSLRFTNTSASDANMINDTGVSVSVTDAFIESPNAPMFDVDGGGTAIFTISSCILDNCTDLGKLTSFIRYQINNGTLIGFVVTGGFEMLGTNGTILIQDIQSGANTAIPTFDMTDAGFTADRLSLTNVTASQLTGTNKFADIDPTKITGGLVADSSFGTTDPVGTAIDNETPNFIVDRVEGIEETRKIGSVSRAPGTVTIVTQSVPVEIGGSWLGANLSQFSALNPGIQYDGASAGDIFQISATVSGSKAGATGSDIYTCAIYINDILVADSLAISEISDKGGSFFMNTFTALSASDHITLFLSNEDTTNNFDLTEAKISVNRVN